MGREEENPGVAQAFANALGSSHDQCNCKFFIFINNIDEVEFECGDD